MPVFKNESNGTWYVMARYVNWKGERKQKCKRGFSTKKEAQERCLPIRKHRGAREKRYSFGYAVFLILALMK